MGMIVSKISSYNIALTYLLFYADNSSILYLHLFVRVYVKYYEFFIIVTINKNNNNKNKNFGKSKILEACKLY